ncbi:hypothetical protein ACQKTA_04190 [Enterococcus sp. 22-H-5-01]|uniref:hypothetical protein n=1 Tax=Enterococcus sp. 22-H-5-01 TaxID=3418555 RepID=UPI003D03F476
MRYKNIKTGAVLDSSFVVSGEHWEAVSNQKKKNLDSIDVNDSVKKEKKKSDIEETNESTSGVSKKEIMQELDAMGIDYDAKAKKDDLYKLMIGE